MLWVGLGLGLGIWSSLGLTSGSGLVLGLGLALPTRAFYTFDIRIRILTSAFHPWLRG